MKKHIYCSAAITQKMHDVFVAIVLSQKDVKEYVIYLTSLGGIAQVGFNLYNFMKARPEKTTVYNMSTVSSAAVQFYLGFENRFGTPNCSFMIHPTTFSKDMLPQQYSAFDARKAFQEIESIERKTVEIIISETSGKAKTPITEQDIHSAMFQTTIIPAGRAVEVGLMDAISQPTLPATDVIYLTDDYLQKI